MRTIRHWRRFDLEGWQRSAIRARHGLSFSPIRGRIFKFSFCATNQSHVIKRSHNLFAYMALYLGQFDQIGLTLIIEFFCRRFGIIEKVSL